MNGWVQIKPWKLEDGDHTLLDLMPFLEAVYKANVPDVRDVVAAYDGQDIPTAFRQVPDRVASVGVLSMLMGNCLTAGQ